MLKQFTPFRLAAAAVLAASAGASASFLPIWVPIPIFDKDTSTPGVFNDTFTFQFTGAGWGEYAGLDTSIPGSKSMQVSFEPNQAPFNIVWKHYNFPSIFEDVDAFAYRQVVGMSTEVAPGEFLRGPLPAGTTISDAVVHTPFGGDFPLTITPLSDLDAPGQLPTSFIDPGGEVATLEWDLDPYIDADHRRGLYFLLSADLPLNAVIPAPGAAGPLLMGSVLALRRRARRA